MMEFERLPGPAGWPRPAWSPARLAASVGWWWRWQSNHEQREKPHGDDEAGSGAGTSTYWLVLVGAIVTSMAGQTLL